MRAATAHPMPATLEPTPRESAETELAWYDDADAWTRFSQRIHKKTSQPADDADLWESFVAVRGMHCAACALTLESALQRVAGVQAVTVSAASATACITWAPAVTAPSIWLAAGQRCGYDLVPVDDTLSFDNDRQQSRLALWRWLVAGFCMMQVMMYAAPTYFAAPGDVSPDIEQLLRWASWVLSLPVLLFSCGPFFSNAWRDLLRRTVSMDLPVAMGIAVTFAVSTAATFAPQGWWGRAVYFDSLTMFVFFLLTGRWLEQRLRSRTAGALGALMQRLPASVERQLPSGVFERVAVRRLRLGDVIRVLPGEAFPADGTLLAGDTFADEALLTGESRPVAHRVGEPVIAGSYNLGQPAVVRVDQLGADTHYAKIVALIAQAALDKPRLALLADQVAKPFLMFVLLAALGAAAFGWRADPAMALMAAVAVLVVTCPCALSLATPTAMLTTAGLLARHGVLVRRLQAIESLADIDTVVFDKTGTLTEPAMRLRAVQVRVGVAPQLALQWAVGLASQSLHPVSRAVVAAGAGLPALAAMNVKEFAGAGVEGRFNSAGPSYGYEGVVGPVRLGSRAFCKIDNADTDTNADANTDAAANPVVDVPVGRVYLADSNGWLATFGLEEALRPDAAQTVTALHARGLSVYLWSGDAQASTARVAALLGIEQAQGNCRPATKLALMKDLQAKGHKVLMVGDGLNDGPTLAAAHVSVAVGAAVPLAQAQSDFILPGAQLLLLPAVLRQAQRTLHVVKQNIAWAAVYNAVCVPLALLGYLPAWLAGLGMASSSLLVVLNAARLSKFKAIH